METDLHHLDAWERITGLVKKEIPNYYNKIKPHWFMPGITITIYPRVYWSSDVYHSKHAWKILAHEYMHLRRAKQMGRWRFLLAYSIPQLFVAFGLLALLAFALSSSWLWWLLALVFALPFPAYWRMKYEVEGYTMSMAVNYWRYGYITNEQLDWTKKVFSSSTYYFMWPFKRYLNKQWNTIVEDIHSGHYNVRPGYTEIRKIIQEVWEV